MTMMKIYENREYHKTIIKPLIEAIEKAGGVEIIARKARISAARLKVILYKSYSMNVITLMHLCSALNITLVFMDMGYKLEPKLFFCNDSKVNLAPTDDTQLTPYQKTILDENFKYVNSDAACEYIRANHEEREGKQ
jgi:DNA-binding phage protein